MDPLVHNRCKFSLKFVKSLSLSENSLATYMKVAKDVYSFTHFTNIF